MTQFWLSLVAVLQGAITLIAAATGGSIGLGIVTVSITLRVALLPLTIRMARWAEAQRALLARLQPELDRLKVRFRNDPERLTSETLALYKRHGVSPLDSSTLGAALVQLPLVGALYSAISRGLGAGRPFLWIADLAKPDIILVGITGALTYFTSVFGASRDIKRTAAVLSAALTIAVMWRVSAALGLYWASSSAVGAAQAFWLSHNRRT